MAIWPTPEYSKADVNRAGLSLAFPPQAKMRASDAQAILTNWRSCHGYPINTFQATLRNKLGRVAKGYLVAQRLKRTPSIISKLRRFPEMKLARMNDIGGLRGILHNVTQVRDVEGAYRESRFLHELVGEKDYIGSPKTSGYRGIHLVYRYRNSRPEAVPYQGLLVELQLRSKIQHAWATAVETAGTFLRQALKSSEGPEEWLDFFARTSSALAVMEDCTVRNEDRHLSVKALFEAVITDADRLNVPSKLRSFSVAANHVTSSPSLGSYHLLVLDARDSRVSVQSYAKKDLAEASLMYTQLEEKYRDNDSIQVVLVSAGSLENLRRAYPNYFLDTVAFLDLITQIRNAV